MVGLGIEIVHPAQGVRVGLHRFDGSQDHGVIGPQADGLVDWTGVTPIERDVLFGADDEEG